MNKNLVDKLLFQFMYDHSSLGIGAGTASLYASIFLGVLIALIVEFINCTRPVQEQILPPRLKSDLDADTMKTVLLHILHRIEEPGKRDALTQHLHGHPLQAALNCANEDIFKFAVDNIPEGNDKSQEILLSKLRNEEDKNPTCFEKISP